MYDDQQQLGDGQDNYLRGAQKLQRRQNKQGPLLRQVQRVKRPPMQPPRQ